MSKKNTSKTISNVVESNQCCNCGVCISVCPKNCISFTDKNNEYVPQIDTDKCINCELCYNVCPGNQFNYNKQYEHSPAPENFWFGSYLDILSMQANNSKILRNSTSGGVVTQLISALLESSEYDHAFLADTFNYSHPVYAKKFDKYDDLKKTAKSRYIPIIQTEGVSYALKNRDKKIIFVGTACFVHGLINIIDKFSLNRNNYLIIGLFCDRTMNYGIYNYFNRHPKCNGKLDKLIFRTKDAGGWPGNMRMVLESNEIIDLKASERMKVKDYFQLERCMYCLDKLNQFADISIGDDYSSSSNDKSGRSAVIIRSEKGMKILKSLDSLFNSHNLTENDIIQGQKLSLRKKNLNYIFEKKLVPQIPETVISEYTKNEALSQEYQKLIAKIDLGRYGSYKEIRADIPLQKKFFYLLINLTRKIWILGFIKNIFKQLKKVLRNPKH